MSLFKTTFRRTKMILLKRHCILFSTIIFLSSCGGQTKEILQNKTPTVTIGSQVWMTSNLNVSYFRSGDIIPEALSKREWVQAGEDRMPAWCYYNYDSSNSKLCVKFYNVYAIMDQRGLAPQGWHIPTDDEWDSLIYYLGGEKIAGEKK